MPLEVSHVEQSLSNPMPLMNEFENVTPKQSMSIFEQQQPAASKQEKCQGDKIDIDDRDLEPIAEPPKKTCEFSDLPYPESYGPFEWASKPNCVTSLGHEESSDAPQPKEEEKIRDANVVPTLIASIEQETPTNSTFNSSNTLHDSEVSILAKSPLLSSPQSPDVCPGTESNTAMQFDKNVPCPRIKIPVSTDPDKITFAQFMELCKNNLSTTSKPKRIQRNVDPNFFKPRLGYINGKKVESKVKTWRDDPKPLSPKTKEIVLPKSPTGAPPRAFSTSRVHLESTKSMKSATKGNFSSISDLKSKKPLSSPTSQINLKKFNSQTENEINQALVHPAKKPSSISSLASTTPSLKQNAVFANKYATLPSKKLDLSMKPISKTSSPSLSSSSKQLGMEIRSSLSRSEKQLYPMTKTQSKANIKVQLENNPTLTRQHTQLLHRLDSVVQLRRRDTLTPQLWNEVVTRSSFRSTANTKASSSTSPSPKVQFKTDSNEKVHSAMIQSSKAESVEKTKKAETTIKHPKSMIPVPTFWSLKEPSPNKTAKLLTSSKPSRLPAPSQLNSNFFSPNAAQVSSGGIHMKKCEASFPSNDMNQTERPEALRPSCSSVFTEPSTSDCLTTKKSTDINKVVPSSSQRRRSSSTVSSSPSPHSSLATSPAPERPRSASFSSKTVVHPQEENEHPFEMLARVQAIVRPPSDLIYLSLLLIYILVAFDCVMGMV